MSAIPLDPEVIRDALRDPANSELVADIFRREIRRDPIWFRAWIEREVRKRGYWPLGRHT